MNENIKKNREIKAIEYLNNNIDDLECTIINNHWEEFLEGVDLIDVKETEEYLNDYALNNEAYVAPSTIYMSVDEDGDIWVAGNESWAEQCFDADATMGEIIDYLVEEFENEYKEVKNFIKQQEEEEREKEEFLKECEKEGFSTVTGRDCNISDYTLDWKEYLDMYDEDPEEYTLEQYAIDNGFVYYGK